MNTVLFVNATIGFSENLLLVDNIDCVMDVKVEFPVRTLVVISHYSVINGKLTG